MLQALPRFPDAVVKGSFQTSWPDALPSAGQNYLATGAPAEIIDFYKDAMRQQGWVLDDEDGPSGLESQGSLLFHNDDFWCRISLYRRDDAIWIVARISKQHL